MPLLIFFIFILLPLAELYVIIQVGQAIGILPTLALLLIDGFIGAALARSQGRLVWTRFNQALGEGRVPGREVMDGAMVLFGGALLLSPGFLTDVLGIFLLLPPGRALVRRMLKGAAKRTPAGRPVFFVYDRSPFGAAGRAGEGQAPGRGPGPVGGSPFEPGAERRGSTAPQSHEWDVEGTAREVPPSGEAAIDSGEPGDPDGPAPR